MAPSQFSAANPRLQVAWDATSFSLLMKCPRLYEYSIIGGWRGIGNVDTAFGGYFASAAEVFKKARLGGYTTEVATRHAVRDAIERTWNPDAGPWSGAYEMLWRCAGSTAFRNAKGNRAKCPWSHAGKWFPAPSPGICGHCGSDVVEERRWVSDNSAKDRPALIRLVTWWCDEQPAEGGIELYAFPDGTPAVELPFRIPLPWTAPTSFKGGGEPYLLTGYLDSIDRLGEEFFISDNKTTKNALGPPYWAQYSPNVQVDIYDLAGSILFPDLGIRGVRIDAAQALVGGARFGTQVFYRRESQREELLGDLHHWITAAEGYAAEGHWPMNRASCYTCAFKPVCSREPAMREMYLKGSGLYERRNWNPLEER